MGASRRQLKILTRTSCCSGGPLRNAEPEASGDRDQALQTLAGGIIEPIFCQ